jgi:hypothetical protein
MQARALTRLALTGCLCGVVGALAWRYASRPAGRTPRPTVERPPLDELTVEQLRRKARDLEIPGRSAMRKQELIDAIAAAG